MSNISFPSILTVEEAAQYLRVTVDELNCELTNGHIPALKIGSSWRIKRDTLDKLLGLSIADNEDKKDEFVTTKNLSESQLKKTKILSNETTNFKEITEITKDEPGVMKRRFLWC